MEHARFGRTGLKVSRLGLGTMSIGSSAWKGWVQDEEASVAILEKALELGITFFDMADFYSAGRGEEIVGRALLARAPREALVLATKAYYPTGGGPNERGLSRIHLMDAIDASLRRIGTDYVDLFIVHAFDPETPIEETMQALDDIRRAGKARYLGASTLYAWQLARMNAVARAGGWAELVNMQCQLSLLYREEEREMIPYCRSEGIAVTTFSPLARGFLSGGGRSARTTFDPYLSDFGDDFDVETARRVAKVAADRGLTSAHVAMAWVCAQPGVAAPLVGADSPEHVQTAVEAATVVLTAEETAFLEEPYRPRDPINDHQPLRRVRGP